MATYVKANIRGSCFGLCVFLISSLVSLPAQAFVDRPGSITASGEGVVFDLKATAAGTLRICTKPSKSDDRWRATIGQATVAGGVSALGTGNNTSFTGCVSKAVIANTQYVVLLTWERPLPGVFPASVTVRFTGPTDTTNPPVTGVSGTALASIVPRPISFVEGGQSCPVDSSTIACGALLTNCKFDSASDLDTFRFSASVNGAAPSAAASLKICGPSYSAWYLFGPTGTLLAGSYGDAAVKLPATGRYTIKTQNDRQSTGTYSLSLEGVSQDYQCGLPIAFSQTKSGTLDACADTDTFQFFCKVNQVVSIKVTGPSYTAWYLYGPTGDLISGSYGVGTATCTTDGTHTIKITNDRNSTGAYSLSLSKVGGP
jgi:hypothetical protein